MSKYIISVGAFLLGGLVGSGAIWQYLESERADEHLAITKMQHTIVLRDKIKDTLLDIFSVTKGAAPITPDIWQQYLLLENDLHEYERQLALLENREPRIFQYRELIAPPTPVTNFGVR